jgi:hypothetical protein
LLLSQLFFHFKVLFFHFASFFHALSFSPFHNFRPPTASLWTVISFTVPLKVLGNDFDQLPRQRIEKIILEINWIEQWKNGKEKMKQNFPFNQMEYESLFTSDLDYFLRVRDWYLQVLTLSSKNCK